MNKTLLASAVAVAGLAVGGATFAAAAPVPMMSGVMNPWYVGIGVNYSAVQTDKIKDSTGDYLKLNNRGVGGNIFAGYRVNQYFGTELGLDMLGSDKYKAALGTTTMTYYSSALKVQDQWNLNFVGQAFLPVTSWFSPYAFGGVAYINSKASALVNASTGARTTDELDGFGFVYGAGLLFNIYQFGIRASYTRQDLVSGSDNHSIALTDGTNTLTYDLPQTKDYISLDVLYRFGA
ncbi:MAG: hypothetical protein A3E87_10535 [Gammaproteobacteria bacterium RIFCSPHIGHO2_12_FULL_35_23]|nr:MAG: hypothetical protein A3E87_10535 [Gammaproteobacteria bacterium RIFCSPHIGHO2_12_FULL_35_23]